MKKLLFLFCAVFLVGVAFPQVNAPPTSDIVKYQIFADQCSTPAPLIYVAPCYDTQIAFDTDIGPGIGVSYSHVSKFNYVSPEYFERWGIGYENPNIDAENGDKYVSYYDYRAYNNAMKKLKQVDRDSRSDIERPQRE